MRPLLSIVTITYNDLAGLEATVESLRPLMGSDLAWEHIVVDSSAEPSALVRREIPGWPLVYIQEPPRGIYPAMNTGFGRAQGEVVQFLNSGDLLMDSEALRALLLRFGRDPGLDMLVAGADLTRKGQFLYSHLPSTRFLQDLLGANRVCHQAVLYRLSSARRVGEYSARWKFAGDYEHHLRSYLAGLKVESAPERIVRYDMDGSSSQYAKVMREFRDVQKSLAVRLGPILSFRMAALFWKESVRIRIVKGLSQSVFAGALGPIWLAWKRRG